jgi:hypothetical protein
MIATMEKNIIKYAISGCFLFLLTTLIPGHSKALDHIYEILIEFSFDTQVAGGEEVSGYRLYKDGISLCDDSGAESQVITCAIDTPGTFDFSLSALYTGGGESPQSAPFQFSVTSEDVAIVALQLLSGQNPQDIENVGSLAGTTAVEMADIIHSLRQSVQ